MTALGEIAALGAERSTPSSEFWFSFGLGRLVAEVSRGELVAAAESATLIATMPDSCRPELWGPQEYVWSEIAVLRARMGDLVGADLALADLDEWLVRARALGYPGEALHASRADAVVALLQGDLDRAGYWTVLPDLEVMRGGRIFLLVEAMLDQVGILRALGARDQCLAVLAQVRVMVDQMADAAGYPGWLEQEEAEAGRGLQAIGDRPGGGVLGADGARHEPPVDAGSQAQPGESDSLVGRSAGAATGSGPSRAALLQPAPAPRASTPGPHARRTPAGVVVEPLSRRELEVLCMLRSEFSLPEIAAHLYVSYSTVKTHTRGIYRKLGVRGRSAAVARGRQYGYL